jgi:hypothetical protein
MYQRLAHRALEEWADRFAAGGVTDIAQTLWRFGAGADAHRGPSPGGQALGVEELDDLPPQGL